MKAFHRPSSLRRVKARSQKLSYGWPHIRNKRTENTPGVWRDLSNITGKNDEEDLK